MMHARAYMSFAAMLLAFMPQTATGQSGQADLRYVAPLPTSVEFTSIDSIHNRMSGFGNEVVVTANIRTVSRLDFPPARSGTVIVTLLEVSGQMTTPRGVQPIPNVSIAPMEIAFSEQGVPDHRLAGRAAPAAGTSAAQHMGSSRMMTGLLRLPGRMLRIGETWDDTVRTSPPIEGMKTDMVVITHGTYAADSVMNGKTINILQITSETSMKMNGAMQGTEMSQTMAVGSEETVGWDSSLHTLVFRNAVGHTTLEMSSGKRGVTTLSNGTVRSMTTMNVAK